MRDTTKITGWANYHRHAYSKKTFYRIDHLLFQALWRWAKRRHPTKSRTWVKKKYFGTQGGNNWSFFGQTTDKQGNPQTIWLCRAGQTRIQRHVKIKGEANPYDPQWELYFEKRLGVKMEQSLQGRKHLLHLWEAQDGLCPICDQKITRLTGWHNHHIVWRSKGGSDRAENRVLIHPTCHNQVHSQEFEVTKLRLENNKSRC